jgi:hypothetical protein
MGGIIGSMYRGYPGLPSKYTNAKYGIIHKRMKMTFEKSFTRLKRIKLNPDMSKIKTKLRFAKSESD